MSNNLTHIHLFGNSSENFYSLGKRDKIAFHAMYAQLSSLCARNNLLVKLLKATTDISRNFVKNNESQNLTDLKAYAEGLEVPFDQVLFAFILPEMVSSFNKFSPHLLSVIPGCSSLFMWDENESGIVHSRILDYALSGTFEDNERSILYDFPNRNKVFSFGTSGIPTPSMSGMNSSGLTVALHYKHNDHFDLTGESIFMIVSEILFHTSDIREAIKLLKTKNSMSLWGLYISDRNGEVASIDICGKDLHHEKFDIKDHKYLYFNNRPLLKKSENLQPYGNKDQCIMRAEIVKERIKNIDVSPATNFLKLGLEVLGAAPSGKKLNPLAWKLTPITPSTLQLYSFHNSKEEAFFIPGNTCKYFNGSYIEIKDLFSDKILQSLKGNEKKLSNLQKGMKLLTKYQTSIDNGDTVIAYHSIQMSIKILGQTTEGAIAKLYFCITQYIFENDKRDLAYLYNDFKSLEGKLPKYLEDQRLLFLMRLEKILNYTVENKSKIIENKNLEKLYKQELLKNSIAIKGLRHLIFPRIDVLDIIYAY